MTEPDTIQPLPCVSVLMPAYNYGRYVGRAVQSVLDQDYPAKLIELIVVDDGSTDDTAAVVGALAERCAGRVRLISQANAGPSAAINRALAEASGELVAILDADDIWLPHKTRRQAALLAAEPALGMVFCDMRVIDGSECLVRPSQVGNIGPFPRRAFASLLGQNRATQSSIMLRRSLARPLPAGVPYSDWWFALCAAQAGEVAYVPEPLALYREHGTNLTSGVQGRAAVREHRKEVSFQLWALRNLDLRSLTPREALAVWHGVELHAQRAAAAAGTQFVELVEGPDGEPDPADGGVLEGWQLLRALGSDPFDGELRRRLVAVAQSG